MKNVIVNHYKIESGGEVGIHIDIDESICAKSRELWSKNGELGNNIYFIKKTGDKEAIKKAEDELESVFQDLDSHNRFYHNLIIKEEEVIVKQFEIENGHPPHLFHFNGFYY